MKNLIILVSILTVIHSATFGQGNKNQKTQAYLGLKEGGEWKWVTKANGNEQYEYQGGVFKPVQSVKVDEKHTDHSFDIQFEGPGWESDKIGYRLYLDWRNAIDIFGKKTDAIVLQNVGLDGFDSYHEMQDWGVDILKVGSALGIGTLAFWDGEKAVRVEKTDGIFSSVENGKNSSKVNVSYSGWEINNTKTDVNSTLEIEAGSYLTKYSVELSKELPNLATGIIKLPETETAVFTDIKPGWSCFVTFGIQSLEKDKLGMCIFFKTNQLMQQTEDKNSHVIVLKPENKKLTWYFGAAWEQDASGVKSMENFKELLKEQAKFVK